MTVIDDTREFSWMLANFVEQTAGVQGAVAVSSDGLLVAMSRSLDRESAEQVAAIVDQRDPRRVIAAILEPGEPLDEDGTRLPGSRVTHDAAHG